MFLLVRRAAGLALILGSLTACHHATPAISARPLTAETLRPRLPVDRAGGWTLPAQDVSLETAEERIALTILERHPSGLPRAAVRETAKAVVAESKANGLDPMLVLALIRVESTNWNWSRSDMNARGLMQVLPTTGKGLARGGHVVWLGPDSLYDPRVNVRLGCRYLAEMREHFSGSIEKALTAYNEGPNRLDRQLKRKHQPDEYATKILWFADRYSAIAESGDDLAPGIARVTLALNQIERDIDYKPAVALARAKRGAKAGAIASRRFDLNRVTFSDLLVLDSKMTPRAAKTIVDWRAVKGGFHSADELTSLGLDAALAKRLKARADVSDVVRTVASNS